jgi:type III restriction enzyme/adenine-specific DNA-methyltransferase
MIKEILQQNETAMPSSREIAVLREHFPACFKDDGSFDIERFKEFLSDKLTVTHEGYELKFLGKNYARLLASLDTTTVIVPDEEHNAKPENAKSENVYISGDNLDGLKHLLKSYSRRVKCIYIDPPYNTGSDGFVYNDSFSFSVEELSEKLSISEEQAQRVLDLTKRGSASHSAWLMFMYPRLLLARDLLTSDGVIFISIDDNEQGNLKLLCDDVFGEENNIGVIANINNPKGRSDDKYFATAHEYLLIYKRSEVEIGEFDAEEKVTKRYRRTDGNGEKFRPIDLRKTGDADLRSDREDMFYPFFYNEHTHELKIGALNEATPDGFIKILPMKTDVIEGRWRWGKSEKAMRDGFKNLFAEYMPNKQQWSIFERDYLKHKKGVKPTTAWTFKDVNSERGTEQFTDLKFDKDVFPKPKPMGTIQRCISVSTTNGDIVLDFFSGSATTAQAVMSLNADDDYNLKYILVQLQEETKEAAKSQGFTTIDQIGMERIKRAALAIRDASPLTMGDLDLGFKHYILAEPSQNTLDKLEQFDPNESKFVASGLLAEFGKATVLATWLNHDGYGLTASPQEIDFAGYKGYYIGKHLYLIDENLSDEAIKTILAKFETDGEFNPENVVLFGYSFLWTERETLQTNLKRLKDTEKNLRINIDIRY